MQSTERTSGQMDPFTFACVLAYVLLGWVLGGIGAVLPDLRDSVGAIGSVYPSLPGACLLVMCLVTVAAEGRSEARAHHDVVRVASAACVAGLGLMVVTGWTPVSVVGAIGMAAMAAALIRMLPAALTAHHPHDNERYMVSANGWSSVAGIAAPLAVGGATAIGLGWRAGYVVPPAVGAALIVLLASRSHGSVDAGHPDAGHHAESATAPPWLDAWLVLTLSILVEFCFAFFASTYLKEEVHMSSAGSAAGAAAFAIGMAGGRFLAGPVRWFGALRTQALLAPVTAGFALMWLVPEPVTAIAGIGVAGLGISLLYPIGIGRLMRRFPDSVERGATRGGLASGTALLSAPLLLGAIRGLSDVRTAYLAVPVLVVALWVTVRQADRRDLPPG